MVDSTEIGHGLSLAGSMYKIQSPSPMRDLASE